MSATILNPNQVPGGTTLPAGDLNSTTNKLEKIQGRNLVIPTLPTTYGDNFNENTIDLTKWVFTPNDYNNGVLITQNNALLLNSGYNGGSTYGNSDILSVNSYALPTNGFLGIKLVNNNFSGKYFGDYVYFRLELNSSNWIQIGLSSFSGDKRFYIYKREAGITSEVGSFALASLESSYVSGNPIWLRLKRVGNSVIFQTSIDNLTYTDRITVTPSFALSGEFKTRTGTFGGGGDVIYATFDDYDTNLGAADTLTDKTLLWYVAATGRFEDVSLVNLKAALNALP
ncbi:MAG: hypothetical protein ACR2MG_20835 [Pyrinomonadaceae bacterium]